MDSCCQLFQMLIIIVPNFVILDNLTYRFIMVLYMNIEEKKIIKVICHFVRYVASLWKFSKTLHQNHINSSNKH